MKQILIVTAFVIGCTTAAYSAAMVFKQQLPYPVEQVPPGCQNLDALPARPIQLRGKVYGTYLPEGRRYSKLKPAQPPDHFEVGVLDLDKPGTPIRRLTNDQLHDAEVIASPRHNQIVWTKRKVLDIFDGPNSIVVANPDMSQQRVVAHLEQGYLGIPSFSFPDGRQLLFSYQTETDRFGRLAFFDLATNKLSFLKTNFRGSFGDPQMSRDGKKIAFKSYEQPDTSEAQLYIMNSDGTGVRRLTKNNYQDEDPAFSPDGRTLVFERAWGASEHKGENPNDWYFSVGVVALNLDTMKETILTPIDPCGKNELWLPKYSPDGEYIMMTRGLHMENGDFTHDLWVMRKDGRDLQRVPGSDGIMFFDWAAQ